MSPGGDTSLRQALRPPVAAPRRANLLLRDSLQPITIGLAILYAFFGASHAAVLPAASGTLLTAAAGTLAVFFFLLSIAFRLAAVPLRWVHPIAAVIVALALGHGLLQIYLLRDPLQTITIALIILGASLLFLSVRWLALVIVVSLVSWTAIAFRSGPAPGWFNFAVLLSATSALGLTINAVRNGMQQRIDELHSQDELRAQQLEGAMQVALESEARFRTVVQTAGSAILVLGADYTALEFNNAAEALYGLRRADVVGQDVRRVFGVTPLEDPLLGQLDRVLSGSPARGIESRVRRRDGRERTVLWNLTGFQDGGGAPAGVIAIGQDITSLKRSAEAQRFLADVSRVLVSSLDDTALVHTVARLAVPQFADWCAVTVMTAEDDGTTTAVAHVDAVKEVQLRELLQRLPGGELSVIAAVRASAQPQLFGAATPGAGEVPQTPDERAVLDEVGAATLMAAPLMARGELRGALVFGLAQPGAVYGADELELLGELAGRIGLAMDNARLYRNAQAALAARDDFLSVAAHELKTPLIALVGATQLFGDGNGASTGDMAQRQIYIIRKATQRLHKQIDSLIELTQIQAGTIGMQRKAVDLCKLAERVVDAVQPAPRHKVHLTCEEPSVMLAGDDARLELALYNLVQNAIKYSPRGGRVEITVGQTAAEAWASVRDEGIGIPEAAQARLFERFYRAGNVNPAQIGGMGIGLHLVEDIVRRHGGTVEITSVEGQGSTFVMRLPRAVPDTAKLLPVAALLDFEPAADNGAARAAE